MTMIAEPQAGQPADPVDPALIDQVVAALAFNDQGLIPAIAQDHQSGEVLMLAWMNAAAVRATLAEGRVTYWSRSRAALWRKGDTSGHTQRLIEFRWDCDADAVLVRVQQAGPACHTGRRRCFYMLAAADGIRATEAPMEGSPAG